MKNCLLSTVIVLLISSCTWVQLTAEGEAVRLSGARLVENCERIGRTTARTLGEIVTVERGGGKQQAEILVLARNEAGRMGGNTIVPESVITDGQQEFGVYRCAR
ncbi:MAG: DUF4156 domain-containing protein [Pseudohongiellaceae bacterium]